MPERLSSIPRSKFRGAPRLHPGGSEVAARTELTRAASHEEIESDLYMCEALVQPWSDLYRLLSEKEAALKKLQDNQAPFSDISRSRRDIVIVRNALDEYIEQAVSLVESIMRARSHRSYFDAAAARPILDRLKAAQGEDTVSQFKAFCELLRDVKSRFENQVPHENTTEL